MRNLTKCIGIFAVGTMMLSTFFVTSCNSEDDFDFGPDSQYSLTERKMTRAGEFITGETTKNDSTIVVTYKFKENLYCYGIGMSYGKSVTTEGTVYKEYDTLGNIVSKGGTVSKVDLGASSNFQVEYATIDWITDNAFDIEVGLVGLSGNSYRGSKAVTIFEE